jgi:hypothetical protein
MVWHLHLLGLLHFACSKNGDPTGQIRRDDKMLLASTTDLADAFAATLDEIAPVRYMAIAEQGLEATSGLDS